MTNHGLRFGDVIRLDFPFVDMQGSKTRPAVVISSDVYHRHKPDIMVANITSKLHPVTEVGEFLIKDWQSAGLDVPSRCKSVVASAAATRITEEVGRFSAGDIENLKKMLRLSLGL